MRNKANCVRSNADLNPRLTPQPDDLLFKLTCRMALNALVLLLASFPDDQHPAFKTCHFYMLCKALVNYQPAENCFSVKFF